MTAKRFQLYGACYLVLIENEKVLLGRHQGAWAAGKYSMVAGHLDGGETMKQSMMREALEETGIILKPEDLEVVLVMHRKSADREYFDAFLLAKKWTGKIEIKEPDKCDDLGFFSLNKLPDDLLGYIKVAIDCIHKGIHYIDYGFSTE
jgi:8-oxo-dGTP diphosphatase